MPSRAMFTCDRNHSFEMTRAENAIAKRSGLETEKVLEEFFCLLSRVGSAISAPKEVNGS